MTDLEKAARMALEALEQLQGGCTDSNDGTVEAITVWCPEVITALRQALEQPAQQEPFKPDWVNYRQGVEDGRAEALEILAKQEPVDWEAVAADQAMTIAMMKAERKPWVGLTEEERGEIACNCGCMSADWLDFARAIEAKLNQKNS